MIVRQKPLARHLHRTLFASFAAIAGVGGVHAAEAMDPANPSSADAETAVDAQATNSTSTQSSTTSVKDRPAVELGNVTVTAQSRTQQVQDVPIPMQIVTSTQIESLAATDLSKMAVYIPGLSVDGTQATQPSFSLRGIGNGDFGVGTDSPIGVYVDGVYTGKTGGSLLTFNDVQRIEVLKGPQGTLFGRNSAGGAISIVTNDPVDGFEGAAKVRLGDYGLRYFDGLLNVPLGEDVALRMSFVDNQSHGWLTDAATGQHYDKNDDWGLRSTLRWNAPGDTVVRFSWEHEELDQPARPAIGLVPLPPAPGTPPLEFDPYNYLNPLHTPVYNDVVDGRETRQFDAFTLRIEHPFAFGDFSSTTAYRRFTTMNREEDDGTNRINLYFDTNNLEHNVSWQQEFKLTGKTDLADWLAGASYYRDDARQTSQLNLFTDSIDTLLNNTGIAPGGLYGPITHGLQANGFQYSLLGDPWQESMINHGVFKAYAAYGDVIWHLTDRLNLTTGVRFTRDEKEFSWYNPLRVATKLDQTLSDLQAFGLLDLLGVPIQTFQQNVEFNSPAAMAAPFVVHNSWNDTSPRVVLDYKLTPEMMLYASVTKGYQAGGFNSVEVNSAYSPETVWNYEAGIKSYFPDYRLLLNASVYYYKYSNLQSLTLVDNGNGNLPLYLVTSSDQDAKGLEFEARWQSTDALRLNFSAAYIDSKYKDNVAPDGTDLSGQPTGTPLWTAAAGADYVLHNVAGGDLDLTLQHAYSGKTRCNADSFVQGACLSARTFHIGGAQNRTDFRIGWAAPDTPWSVAIFVNNLFDKRYVSGINNITASVLGTPFANISPPRMWGVEAAAHF